jgi:hypothetical protein
MEAWLRASDVAGVWAYWQDDLLRIASHNLDHWHSGGGKWLRNDQGEISEVDELTPFAWEALGLWQQSQAAFKPSNASGNCGGSDEQLEYVPAKADQCGLPRHRVFRGYLGGVCRRETILPLAKPGAVPEPASLSGPSAGNLTGLCSVQEHRDGRYSVRSAKGIVLEKYLYIPVAWQTALPESEKGDNAATDYAPCGVAPTTNSPGASNIPEHVCSEPTVAEPDRPDLLVAQLFDLHAHLFNRIAVRPFTAHKKDWSLPDEGGFAHKESDPTAAASLSGVYMPKPVGGQSPLASRYVFDMPTQLDVDVDPSTKSRYYCSRSFVELLPDGGVAIEDGYGSGIYMTGGNIRLTCAGDILMQPGRSLVAMCGDDVALRAGTSLDLSAAVGDVRVKAERNLHMLAGNGAMGGVLVESRSAPIAHDAAFLSGKLGEEALTGGIVLAVRSGTPLVLRGSDIRLIAEGTTDGNGVPRNDGAIILEATGAIGMEASFFRRNATGAGLGYVDSVDGDPVMAFTQERYMLDVGTEAVLKAGQQIAFGCNTYTDGTAAVADVKLIENASQIVDSIVSGAEAWIANVGGGQSVEAYMDAVAARSEWLLGAGFTCRTPAQYGTDVATFCIAEARWQRSYRERGILLSMQEPKVYADPGNTGSTATLPYPGHDAWYSGSRYRRVDSKLFNWAGGKAADRDSSEYADGNAVAKLVSVDMHDNYLISRQGL